MTLKLAVSLFACAVLASGCTQDRRAQVEYKGSQKYNDKSGYSQRSSHSTYQDTNTYSSPQNPRAGYPHPVSESTEGKVSVDSVGVSDLPPPK